MDEIKRPSFKDIKSYDEFKKYYWYREELKTICKNLNIDCIGNKPKLNYNIEQYFKGNLIKKDNNNNNIINKKKANIIKIDEITLETKIIECDFKFNQKFRDFFIKETKKESFKFNANMVASVKKAKEINDSNFTIKDLLDIYLGNTKYAEFDNSSCQWNQFVKDFCNDKFNDKFINKLKVASILWKKVRDSDKEKVYSRKLVEKNIDIIKKYSSK